MAQIVSKKMAPIALPAVHRGAAAWVSHRGCGSLSAPRSRADHRADQHAGPRRAAVDPPPAAPHRRSAPAGAHPSLPYKGDTSRPSLRTNWTRLVPLRRAAPVPPQDGGAHGARGVGAGGGAAGCGEPGGWVGAWRGGERSGGVPPPSPRADWTRRVPPPVRTGCAAALLRAPPRAAADEHRRASQRRDAAWAEARAAGAT